MFRVLETFFRALSDGKIIRLTVAWVLRILAGLGALGGLLWFITFVGLGFKLYDAALGAKSAAVLAGCLVFSVFGLAMGYLWLGICLFRARSVLELGDSHFTVLSILSILFRLNGELIFVSYALIGVGGCLFVWLSDSNPISQLGPLSSEVPFGLAEAGGFIGGIELAVFMLLLAFAGIVVFYALAELSIVLVEIALNTRGIPAMVVAAGPAAVAIPVAAPVVATRAPAVAPSTVVVTSSTCRQCGQILDVSAGFCAECGTAVG